MHGVIKKPDNFKNFETLLQKHHVYYQCFPKFKLVIIIWDGSCGPRSLQSNCLIEEVSAIIVQ